MKKEDKNVLKTALKYLRSNDRNNPLIPRWYRDESHPISQLEDLLDKEDNLENQFESLESKLLEKLGQVQTPVEEEKTPIYENLDNYYNEYIEHRKTFDKISNSSVKGYNASMRYFKYFTTPQTKFNFKFFKELQKKFQKLPKNFFKYPKYYKKSFEELLELKEKENYDTLDNKTINNHLNSYKLFFNYLKYEEHIEVNPLSDIQPLPETKGTNKEEYTLEELKKIFNSDMDLDYINMCKVSLYCGLRIEEVMSIKKVDIKDNLIYIDLEDTGTKKHQRIVPIHKNLKAAIDRQKKTNRGEYLFFNGNVDNEVTNVGKRVNRRLKTIIPIKEKTFHSFRKNFSQELELNTTTEDKVKKYLMGHSQSKDITHTIYNRGKVNIDKLRGCIDQITFNY